MFPSQASTRRSTRKGYAGRPASLRRASQSSRRARPVGRGKCSASSAASANGPRKSSPRKKTATPSQSFARRAMASSLSPRQGSAHRTTTARASPKRSGVPISKRSSSGVISSAKNTSLRAGPRSLSRAASLRSESNGSPEYTPNRTLIAASTYTTRGNRTTLDRRGGRSYHWR